MTAQATSLLRQNLIEPDHAVCGRRSRCPQSGRWRGNPASAYRPCDAGTGTADFHRAAERRAITGATPRRRPGPGRPDGPFSRPGSAATNRSRSGTPEAASAGARREAEWDPRRSHHRPGIRHELPKKRLLCLLETDLVAQLCTWRSCELVVVEQANPRSPEEILGACCAVDHHGLLVAPLWREVCAAFGLPGRLFNPISQDLTGMVSSIREKASFDLAQIEYRLERLDQPRTRLAGKLADPDLSNTMKCRVRRTYHRTRESWEHHLARRGRLHARAGEIPIDRLRFAPAVHGAARPR